MRKTTTALLATSAGLSLLIGAKAASGGAPRPALAGSSQAAGPTGGASGGPATPVPGPGAATRSAAGSGPTPVGAPTPRPTPGAVSGTFTGSVIDTRYGPVQVAAVLAGGKLTDVTVLQRTQGSHSSQIDSYALPQLKAEALKAQSANIDAVSGATYTSDGYAQSLQAALDAAHR